MKLLKKKYFHFEGFIPWLILLMTLCSFALVIERYVFSISKIWQQELIIYLHSIIFMSSAAFTYRKNAHVRIDIFYEKFSKKRKKTIEILGILLFLLPFCFAIIYFSKDFIFESWRIKESSRESDGIQAIFLLKSLILIYPIPLIIYSIQKIIHLVKK